MKKGILISTLMIGLIFTGTAVFAAYTFDAATGTGFVGKGDVQLVYGWNNKALQDNASSVQFQANSSVVTELSWECTNSKNEKIQERKRTTTTSNQGLVSTVARLKNQVTGFNLNGYSGTPIESTDTDGPDVNSCPNENGSWSLTTPAGDPEVISSEGGGLEVSIDGITWIPLVAPVI